MVSLAGLSGAFRGYQEAETAGTQNQIRQFELDKSKSAFKALDSAGDALLNMFPMPGAQPMPGANPAMQGAPQMGAPPQPTMQPGQPSMPSQPPLGQGAPPGSQMANMGERWPAQPMQGSPGPPPGGMPPPGAGPPVGPGGGIDLRTFLATLKARNPNISGQEAAQAVLQSLPIFNQESKQLLQALNLQLRSQGLDVREDIARMQEEGRRQRFNKGEEGKDFRLGQTEEGKDRRLDKTEEGKGQRLEKTEQGKGERLDKTEGGRQKRFDAREERLKRQGDEKHEVAIARIAQDDKKLEALRAQRDRSASLAEKRAAIDAIHKHVLDTATAYSVMNNLPAKDRKALREEIDKAYDQEIKQLRSILPKPGDVRDGFKFKGGDPAKPESWEKVK